jgi:hypothetical protein
MLFNARRRQSLHAEKLSAGAIVKLVGCAQVCPRIFPGKGMPTILVIVSDLSKQLATAVKTMPPLGGAVPELKAGLWNTTLTNP